MEGVSPIGDTPSEAAGPSSAPPEGSLLRRALHHILADEPLRWKKAASIDACAGVQAPHDWCIMLPLSQRVQPSVYTLMARHGLCAEAVPSCRHGHLLRQRWGCP